MADPIQTRLVHQSTAESPLGGISLAGYIKNSLGVPQDPMRVFGRYALVYLLEGSGVYQDGNGIRRTVQRGDVIFVFPDLPHAYGPVSGQSWSEFYVVFTGSVFDLWRRSGLWDVAQPTRHAEPVEYWLRRLEEAVGETRAGAPPDPLGQVCRLQQLMADLLSTGRAAGDDPQSMQWLAAATALLDQPRSLQEAASAMGLGYEAFRKTFTRLAGVPPAKHRAGRTIARACELLRDPRQSTRQVATACGFCDEFHFSRRFKQAIGLLPAEFRKRLPAR